MDKDISKYIETAEILKVLAHPVRICIVKGLLDNGECNVSHMQNCLNVPQSTISQNLQKLRVAGIIEGRRSGLEIYYRVCNEKVANLINMLLSGEK
ncbi:ArsR/SmtB family transcription factor [Clostridium magnum]|uniref:Transcriptional repressor PagR n=1 Tax=Clostridium magnum DSM 2767 TaxID=1121326 RepID=A0A168DVJ2_9CLOT|nr:metalloregulator ArsR/SmtB family transcription factor [Clostridium magnum]KZL91523.1 transcriptional repressor PagR [Clostridium magnum DSM 2767]SHH45994.1 transcriptional regulator, ArsR family [Clostridium magnum DSM 2767]